MGPVEEYADEKPNRPIELRVYPGANASFSLYSDEGDTRNYEVGKFSLVKISWSENDGVLTIGARQGSYPGMPKDQNFKIVVEREGHGVGINQEEKPDRNVVYHGDEIRVRLK